MSLTCQAHQPVCLIFEGNGMMKLFTETRPMPADTEQTGLQVLDAAALAGVAGGKIPVHVRACPEVINAPHPG